MLGCILQGDDRGKGDLLWGWRRKWRKIGQGGQWHRWNGWDEEWNWPVEILRLVDKNGAVLWFVYDDGSFNVSCVTLLSRPLLEFVEEIFHHVQGPCMEICE